MAIFRKMVKGDSVLRMEDGGIKITFQELTQIPTDEGIKAHYDPETDSFTLSIIKIKRQKIITPNKRIIA